VSTNEPIARAQGQDGNPAPMSWPLRRHRWTTRNSKSNQNLNSHQRETIVGMV